MEYVYKYLDDRGEVAYVGITKNMERRVSQHLTNKLKEIKDPTIYYFPVMYRGDAELLETYLIGHYKTGQRYNVSKTKKGDFSFFDICDELPWIRYNGKVDAKLEPFQTSKHRKEIVIEKEVPVEKRVYVDDTSSLEKIIHKLDQDERESKQFFESELDAETTIVEYLHDLVSKHPNNEIALTGYKLHKERLDALTEANDAEVWAIPFTKESEEHRDALLRRCSDAFKAIEEFEIPLGGMR